ncbi:MAG: hypothetical protein WDM80_13900 [Limisphaerales bacterium]
MTDRAKMLFEDAEKYAQSFNEIFMDMDCRTELDVLSRGKWIVEFFKKSEELKIHFLFPNVSEEVRDAFFKLAWKRSALLVGRKVEGNDGLNAQIEKAEREFAEISSSVRELLDDLLPVQAEIISEKYLSSPFSR